MFTYTKSMYVCYYFMSLFRHFW